MKKVLKSGAFIAFIIGFAMYIAVMLPELIDKNGILIIDGDWRYQSLTFPFHIRDCILSGNLIWDGSTGMGGQFLSLYAYYNLFSPFSAFYLIIPRELIIYATPYVSALKYGIGSMLGYLFIKRFTYNKHYAVIGGLLYMFSSFSAYNICFHFDDIIAIFPLMLIALDELCIKRRYGVFAITVGFMGMLNYYFFFGQVVFVIIYFFIRGAFDKKFGLSVKLTLRVLSEGILGVILSAAVLLPVGISLSESAKATTTLSLDSMLFYDDIFHYLKIIQSAFMIPDGFNLTTLFPENDIAYPFGVIGASIAAYLPLFSLTGVISYVWAKRKDWMSVILTVCVVFAFIPVLNQVFSAFNSGYYARWYYMPILIASIVSVKALEERISFKPGIITCSVLLAAFTLYFVFADTESIIVKYGNGRSILMPLLTVFNIAIPVISIILVIVIVKLKRDKDYIPKLYIFSIMGIYMCFGIMAFYIVGNYGEKDQYIEYCFAGNESEVELENCARLSFSDNSSNLNHIWGYNSLNEFNSLADPGYERFIEANGLTIYNNMRSSIDGLWPELGGVASAKYYLSEMPVELEEEGYKYIGSFGSYKLLENIYYIPMGYTYDKMISYERFEKIEEKKEKHRVYAGYMVADNPSDFEGILTLSDDEYKYAESDEDYLELVEKIRSETADSVIETTDGYVVEISPKKKTVMCLSVSYNDNWKAYIDGEETKVYEINNGIIGIIVPEGEHKIEFKYTIPGFTAGLIISGAGALVIAAYTVISKKKCVAKA